MFNEKQVLHTTIQLTVLLGFGFLVFHWQIAMSLILGGLMSCFAFQLLTLHATKLLREATTKRLSPKDVKRYNFKGFVQRCSLYAATMIIALRSPHLHFCAVLVGLLLPRLSITYLLIRGRIIRGT